MIIRAQKVRFSPDRKPVPKKLKLGFEGDNMVERLEFDLPEIARMQSVTLMMGGKYANAVTLASDGEDYYVDLTADLVGAEGVIDAYVRIDGEGGEVWQSDVLRLVTGDVPDVETKIEQRFPTAVETMLTEMAEHRGEMEEQVSAAGDAADAAGEHRDACEAAAQRAEEAAERAESAQPEVILPPATAETLGGIKVGEGLKILMDGTLSVEEMGGGVATETDPTVPAWAKQANKPTYTAEEVGADAKGSAAAAGAQALSEANAYTDRQVAAIPMPDISHKLDADKLPEAVEDALAQAKASGEFDGAQGPKGEKGDKGDPGADGVSATHSWNGTVLAVTSASGTSSADLKGEKGDTGAKGEQGEPGEKGDTGADGADGKDGYTPVKGTDYFTAADKAEMVAAVKAALSSETWTFTLSDGSTVTKKVYVS